MRLFAEHCPDINVYNIIDDSLLDEVSRAGYVTDGVQNRMNAYIAQAASLNPDLILNQCSSVGEAFEKGCVSLTVPALRIDAPMAEQAASICPENGKITVVATVKSTVAPSVHLVESKVKASGKNLAVDSVLIDGALDILMKEKNRAKHDDILSKSVRDACAACDAIVLAQGSMYEISRKMQDFGKPVLSSPLLGVLKVKDILFGGAAL